MNHRPTRRGMILGLAAAALPWGVASAGQDAELVLVYDATRFKLAPTSLDAFHRPELYRGPRAATSIHSVEALASLFAAGAAAMALAPRAVATELISDPRLSLGIVA